MYILSSCPACGCILLVQLLIEYVYTHLQLSVSSYLLQLAASYPKQYSCSYHHRHASAHSQPRCCPVGPWLPTQDQLLLHHKSPQDRSTDSSAQWWMALLQLCTPKLGWCLAPLLQCWGRHRGQLHKCKVRSIANSHRRVWELLYCFRSEGDACTLSKASLLSLHYPLYKYAARCTV